ncbi:MAG: rhodanese-like domain-containing protein [Thainema sp.]
MRIRLEFGRPDLTILDVRDRKSFNQEHISGAIPAPLNQLPGLVRTILEPDRDIYLYGESDQETTLAANKLRSAGFNRVSELIGGLPAWKAIDGATEGYTDW